MRARYFRISFIVLTVVTFCATVLHGVFLRQARLADIDEQLRETAAALLDTNINAVRKLRFTEVESVLSEELGESRIGKFFIIHNDKGEKLFESTTARLLTLPEPMPRKPQWLSYHINGNYIRVLNLDLPRIPDRTLQVGLVVHESLLSPDAFSTPNLLFIGCIFLLGLAAAWALTSSLMKPVSRLVDHLAEAADAPTVDIAPLPPSLTKRGLFMSRKDELVRLVDTFSSLMDKINRNQKLLRSWSYQMAHELKTPMALMEGEISRAQRQGEISAGAAAKVRGELLEASETVSAFLTWAELEGACPREQLYAVSVRKTLDELQRRLAARYPARLRLELAEDFYVLAGRQHFEHMLLNLVQNALSYSGGDVTVLSPAARTLVIRDRGPGFPSAVLARLGEPFNRGSGSGARSNGLGLAYVQSVCRVYGWSFAVASGADGSDVRLEFPKESGAGLTAKRETHKASAEPRA